MIDPITEYLLQEQEQKEFNSLIESIWDAPKLFGDISSKKFGINWRVFNLATVNMKKFKQQVQDIVDQASKKAHEAGYSKGHQSGMFKGLASAALAAAVIAIAYQVYKRYISKAAKACSKYKGAEKTSCMNRYRRESMKEQIKELEMGYPLCDKTNDVYGCRYKIKSKLRKLKTKLGEL